MPHYGQYLEPGPQDVSAWTWIFESQAGGTALKDTKGFIDAASGASLPFSDLKTKAMHTSTALSKNYGIKPGQVISIACRNSLWYPIAFFAVFRLGAVVSPLPNVAKASDLEYYLRASGSTMIFADAENVGEVKQAAEKIGMSRDRVVVMDGQCLGLASLEDLVRSGRDAQTQVPAWKPLRSNAEECAMMCFSSGTTGLPKAMMNSHSNIIAQLRQMRQVTPPDRHYTVLGILPFYHITGLIQLLQLPLVLNQDIVIMGNFKMRDMMETIVKYKCTELWLVPPLLIRLVNEPIVDNYDISFVKQFDTGAAPLSDQLVAKLAAKFPKVDLRQAWGMTESTSALTVTPPDLCRWEHAVKVGRLVPGTQIKIVDPDSGKEVGLGETGEIAMGYLNNSRATEETFDKDGFLHTGDLGSMDGAGFIRIHDRIKEMIKVRGHGIAPADLEDTILGHPHVTDVGVIGIPDEYSGELPRAYIVVAQDAETKKDKEQMAQEVVEFVRERKARYQWLAGGVEVVDEIPKSASGKILRRQLKMQWRGDQERKSGRAKL